MDVFHVPCICLIDAIDSEMVSPEGLAPVNAATMLSK